MAMSVVRGVTETSNNVGRNVLDETSTMSIGTQGPPIVYAPGGIVAASMDRGGIGTHGAEDVGPIDDGIYHEAYILRLHGVQDDRRMDRLDNLVDDPGDADHVFGDGLSPIGGIDEMPASQVNEMMGTMEWSIPRVSFDALRPALGVSGRDRAELVEDVGIVREVRPTSEIMDIADDDLVAAMETILSHHNVRCVSLPMNVDMWSTSQLSNPFLRQFQITFAEGLLDPEFHYQMREIAYGFSNDGPIVWTLIEKRSMDTLLRLCYDGMMGGRMLESERAARMSLANELSCHVAERKRVLAQAETRVSEAEKRNSLLDHQLTESNRLRGELVEEQSRILRENANLKRELGSITSQLNETKRMIVDQRFTPSFSQPTYPRSGLGPACDPHAGSGRGAPQGAGLPTGSGSSNSHRTWHSYPTDGTGVIHGSCSGGIGLSNNNSIQQQQQRPPQQQLQKDNHQPGGRIPNGGGPPGPPGGIPGHHRYNDPECQLCRNEQAILPCSRCGAFIGPRCRAQATSLCVRCFPSAHVQVHHMESSDGPNPDRNYHQHEGSPFGGTTRPGYGNAPRDTADGRNSGPVTFNTSGCTMVQINKDGLNYAILGASLRKRYPKDIGLICFKDPIADAHADLRRMFQYPIIDTNKGVVYEMHQLETFFMRTKGRRPTIFMVFHEIGYWIVKDAFGNNVKCIPIDNSTNNTNSAVLPNTNGIIPPLPNVPAAAQQQGPSNGGPSGPGGSGGNGGNGGGGGGPPGGDPPGGPSPADSPTDHPQVPHPNSSAYQSSTSTRGHKVKSIEIKPEPLPEHARDWLREFADTVRISYPADPAGAVKWAQFIGEAKCIEDLYTTDFPDLEAECMRTVKSIAKTKLCMTKFQRLTNRGLGTGENPLNGGRGIQSRQLIWSMLQDKKPPEDQTGIYERADLTHVKLGYYCKNPEKPDECTTEELEIFMIEWDNIIDEMKTKPSPEDRFECFWKQIRFVKIIAYEIKSFEQTEKHLKGTGDGYQRLRTICVECIKQAKREKNDERIKKARRNDKKINALPGPSVDSSSERSTRGRTRLRTRSRSWASNGGRKYSPKGTHTSPRGTRYKRSGSKISPNGTRYHRNSTKTTPRSRLRSRSRSYSRSKSPAGRRLCREFKRKGSCKYGNSCRYSHGRSSRNSAPSPTAGTDIPTNAAPGSPAKNGSCKFHIQNPGGCLKGAKCDRVHDDDARRKFQANPKPGAPGTTTPTTPDKGSGNDHQGVTSSEAREDSPHPSKE